VIVLGNSELGIGPTEAATPYSLVVNQVV